MATGDARAISYIIEIKEAEMALRASEINVESSKPQKTQENTQIFEEDSEEDEQTFQAASAAATATAESSTQA